MKLWTKAVMEDVLARIDVEMSTGLNAELNIGNITTVSAPGYRLLSGCCWVLGEVVCDFNAY